MFGDLPNIDVIINRINDISAPARTIERRITELGDDDKDKQTTALNETAVFSVAVDESTDVNEMPRVAIFARYCSSGKIFVELCCLKLLPETTMGKDLFEAFASHF